MIEKLTTSKRVPGRFYRSCGLIRGEKVLFFFHTQLEKPNVEHYEAILNLDALAETISDGMTGPAPLTICKAFAMYFPAASNKWMDDDFEYVLAMMRYGKDLQNLLSDDYDFK
jgi:hypothetical protein